MTPRNEQFEGDPRTITAVPQGPSAIEETLHHLKTVVVSVTLCAKHCAVLTFSTLLSLCVRAE